MRRFALLLLYGGLFLFALMFLAPKTNLYYLFEEQVRPLGIIIDGETVSDQGLSLEITDGTLYARQIESASAASISVGLFGLYNRIEVTDLRLAETLAKFWPQEITGLRITYTAWDPLHLNLQAEGDFGTATGVLSLTERSVSAVVRPSKLMLSRFRSTLRQLKHDGKGEYRYESRF